MKSIKIAAQLLQKNKSYSATHKMYSIFICRISQTNTNIRAVSWWLNKQTFSSVETELTSSRRLYRYSIQLNNLNIYRTRRKVLGINAPIENFNFFPFHIKIAVCVCVCSMPVCVYLAQLERGQWPVWPREQIPFHRWLNGLCQCHVPIFFPRHLLRFGRIQNSASKLCSFWAAHTNSVERKQSRCALEWWTTCYHWFVSQQCRIIASQANWWRHCFVHIVGLVTLNSNRYMHGGTRDQCTREYPDAIANGNRDIDTSEANQIYWHTTELIAWALNYL